LTKILSSLGFALRFEDPDKAFEYLQRALDIQRQVHTAEHPTVAIALESIGVAHWAQRQLVEAESYLRQSLVMKQKMWGKEHPNIISSLSNLGRLLNEQGRFAEALPLCDRAFRLAEQAGMLDGIQAGDARLCAGESYLGLQRSSEAQKALEQAIEMLLPIAGSQEYLADGRFNLARALWSRGRRSEQINRLVAEARDAYLAMGASGKHPLSRLDTWLQTRG
jgi:tetratricopeptide (TPR) repeat protein